MTFSVGNGPQEMKASVFLHDGLRRNSTHACVCMLIYTRLISLGTIVYLSINCMPGCYSNVNAAVDILALAGAGLVPIRFQDGSRIQSDITSWL